MDGSDEAAVATSLRASAGALDAFLDEVLDSERVTPAQMALVGFSQGTMMALHVAPRRAEPVAGIVGFSGRLLVPERLAAEAVSRPPVLLVHGDADEIVPPASMPDAEAALKAAGFGVLTRVSEGIGHGIAPDGLSAALGFLRETLPG